MGEEILFQITRENLETGLRGVPVGYCITSSVYPDKGLYYLDYPISEVASWEPEEVIYLLYHGKKGEKEETKKFASDLKSRAIVSKEVIDAIYRLPRAGHPMKLFPAALLIAAMFEGKNNYKEDGLNLIAQIPTIAAAVINHHAGWGATPPSRPELGYMENFTQMLNLPHKGMPQLPEVFKLFNILHYDHGGGNLSMFVGKAVASGLEDMYGSICAAMNALAGPRHGRANQECLAFVEEVLSSVGKDANPAKVEAFIRQKMEKKELIYGFGHAVLRVEDPRATLFYAFAEKYYPENPLVKTALVLRKEGSRVLKENLKIADPYTNIDAISGVLLTAAGFPYPEYYTVLFGLARTVGLVVQIIYERLEARGGKGTPIIRPKYFFLKRENLPTPSKPL